MTEMNYCSYKNFNTDNLSNLKPEQAKNLKVPCWYINLLYNLGSKECPDFNDFEMELCEFTSPVGISIKENQQDDGTVRIDESILIKFDLANEEHKQCLTVLDELHTKLAEIIYEVRGPLKKFDFNAKNPESSNFKKLVYYQRDEMTGDIIPGRAPSMFLKLFSWGTGATANSSLFVDIDNKPIDRKLLSGVELKFIPLLQIRRIRSAASFSVNMEIKSAIVTSVKARNTESSQLYTLKSLQMQKPELKNLVSSQVARLTATRQNKLPPSLEPTVEEQQQPEESTLSGLVPTPQPEPVKKAPKREFKIPLTDK